MKLFGRILYAIIFGLALGMLSSVGAQSTPIDINHPVNTFLRQQITLKHIDPISVGTMPYTHSEVQKALSSLATNKALSDSEKKTLHVFLKEFDVSTFEEGLLFIWDRALRDEFKKQCFSFENPTAHIFTYKDDVLTTWADMSETIRWLGNNGGTQQFNTERLSIHGVLNNSLSFHSEYQLHRLKYDDLESVVMPVEFKQGHKKTFDEVSMIIWDLSQASLVYENSILNIEISKKPLYWGLSPNHSPILSDHVLPFTYLGISTHYKRVKFTSIHGSLIPYANISREIDHPEKQVAAHRIDISTKYSIDLSFSEIVIYANRAMEPGYMLPLNFFWSEEHTLGDRDNVLMALEGRWRPKSGFELYGTVLLDELSFFDLFSRWWGNKFIFQTGFYWVPKTNLPDLLIEFTAARPWVYTHDDSLNTFTSSGLGLGFPYGPNSQLLHIESNYWLTPQSLWTISYSHLLKGDAIGSDPNDNYYDRDPILDHDTPFLLGNVSKSNIFELNGDYRFSYHLKGFLNIIYNDNSESIQSRIGVVINL